MKHTYHTWFHRSILKLASLASQQIDWERLKQTYGGEGTVSRYYDINTVSIPAIDTLIDHAIDVDTISISIEPHHFLIYCFTIDKAA